MQLVPFNEMQQMAEAIAGSGLFGLKTPQQALALGLLCQAEGRHPAEAARDYHVIQGRPTLKADTMLARFQSAGGRVEWPVYSDKKVVGVFSHPSGGTLTLDWDWERAKSAGLASRDTWKQYPRQMLRARVISEAIRTILPGVLSGCYLPDELPEMPITATVTAEPALALPLRFDIAAAVATLNASETMDELRNAWASVIQSAPPEALAELTAAKDNRKTELA
jgi:hypothetical protein